MSNVKKLLASALMATLVSSAVLPSVSASEVKPSVSVAAQKADDYGFNLDHPFTDVGSRYEDAVAFLYDAEIINGKTATSFGTNHNLTRGDAAVILANTLGLDTDNAPDAGFKDLNSRVAGSVNALADAGIVSGKTADTFGTSDPLSRGAMAKFLSLSFELEAYAEQTPFSDVGGVFAPYIEALYGAGITTGKTETSYGTHTNITRGDFANLLYRSIMFMIDNVYLPYAESVTSISSTSFSITLKEAAPEDYTAGNIWDMFMVDIELEDGSSIYVNPSSISLSPDRKVLTVNHASYDLAGKSGTIWVDNEISVDFNYMN
ncbi:S-layer homology domain-containing protein [Cytobacillus spongiae]|uniref:S-layer homology domain-containing protein n=1 Tax=Cytobacillus spongiae TaxID=2901381 RepID=UPI001F3D02A6|nr:S-layer homology domain-containing protein [Cytobacillus spongiae]UII55668.1 S-layer homology domain-containing protein [Cytobacillus spongiae]